MGLPVELCVTNTGRGLYLPHRAVREGSVPRPPLHPPAWYWSGGDASLSLEVIFEGRLGSCYTEVAYHPAACSAGHQVKDSAGAPALWSFHCPGLKTA